MDENKLKTGSVARKAASAYRKLEDALVGGYKKVEDAVVGGYQKIEDKFTGTFLEEDGPLKTGGMAEKATSAYQKVEDTVVSGYKKVEHAFTGAFRERGESTAPFKPDAPEAE